MYLLKLMKYFELYYFGIFSLLSLRLFSADLELKEIPCEYKLKIVKDIANTAVEKEKTQQSYMSYALNDCNAILYPLMSNTQRTMKPQQKADLVKSFSTCMENAKFKAILDGVGKIELLEHAVAGPAFIDLQTLLTSRTAHFILNLIDRNNELVDSTSPSWKKIKLLKFIISLDGINTYHFDIHLSSIFYNDVTLGDLGELRRAFENASVKKEPKLQALFFEPRSDPEKKECLLFYQSGLGLKTSLNPETKSQRLLDKSIYSLGIQALEIFSIK